MNEFKATFLGTGTSQGIPVIACNCEVCLSDNPKDKRLRTSLMLTIDGRNIVIDTGPDFRQQMLREQVQTLDAVLFTHEHKDHISGMDDIRAFNFRAKIPMEIYASDLVEIGLKREFHYVFGDFNYPGIPQVNLNRIGDEPFTVLGEKIIPINVLHYKLPVKAFRVRDFSYVTDANFIADEEMEKLKGTKYLVVNALRKTEHISHFNSEQALELIETIGPEKAYLTHLSHLMGKEEDVSKELPKNVVIAHDGLAINLNEV